MTKRNNTNKEIKEEEKIEEPVKEKLIRITALKNTFLPDGEFVEKGQIIEVTQEFIDRIKKENDKSFLIS